MCIANDYDRYDDDGSLDLDLDDTEYDQDIDTVRNVFDLMIDGNTDPASRVLSNCCSVITSLVDKELGNLLFINMLKTAGTCV